MPRNGKSLFPVNYLSCAKKIEVAAADACPTSAAAQISQTAGGGIHLTRERTILP